MQKMRLFSVVMSFALLVLCSSGGISQQSSNYLVTVGQEQLLFIPRPDLGHVIKAKEMQGNISVLSTIQGVDETVDIKRVGGSGLTDTYVVNSHIGIQQNKQLSTALDRQSDVEYMLPLFEIDGEILALMPNIIVRLVNDKDYSQLMDFCENNNYSIIRNIIYSDLEYLIEPLQKSGDELLDIIDELNRMDFVEWAFPDVALDVDLCGFEDEEIPDRIEPNDQYYPNQWHLENIRTPEAWTITQGDPNIIVAVLDNGIDITHPDLRDNIWTNPGEIPDNGIDDDGNGLIDDVHGWNFINDNNDVYPHSDDAHGTACAGLIAARGNNNLGVTGVTWNCTIMPIRAVSDTVFQCVSGMALAEAFRYAAAQGADVISNSWGLIETYERIPFDPFHREYERTFSCSYIYDAIKEITIENGIGRNGKGCVVCCASGNEGKTEYWTGSRLVYPAAYPEVIAVGAINKDNERWSYSGYGSALDIVAPSGDGAIGSLWTTDITGSKGDNNYVDPNTLDYTDKMSGTSGACPIAAGVAALVLSIDPNLSTKEISSILLHSAKDLGNFGWDAYYGYGCVDAYAAVTSVLIPLTIYVDDDADNDPGKGDPDISDPLENGSLEHPFDSIQEAIDHTVYKDNIVILPGIYKGEGNYDIDFEGRIIAVRSQESSESCIIDCQYMGRGFSFSNGEEHQSILDGFTIKNGFTNDEGGGIYNHQSNATIINCNFAGNSAESGSGIYNSQSNPTINNCIFSGNSAKTGSGIYNSQSNPTVSYCTFIKNSVNDKGGGIYNHQSSAIITCCTFTEDSAKSGGGIYNSQSSPTISDCKFVSNSADHSGGGLYNYNSNSSVTNCRFAGNLSEFGGGMFNSSSSSTITNCTFTNNSAGSKGGGMYNSSTSFPIINNCTFSGNTANSYGAGIFNYSSSPDITNCTFNGNSADSYLGGVIYNYQSSPTITNCILWDEGYEIWNESRSEIIIAYSNIKGGQISIYDKYGYVVWDQSNIDSDPYFINHGYWAAVDDSNIVVEPNDPNAIWIDGDYHLKSQAGRWDPVSKSWVQDEVTSPCIDVGDPVMDWAEELWPHGIRINMGAFGGTTQASMSLSSAGDIRDLTNNGSVTLNDVKK